MQFRHLAPAAALAVAVALPGVSFAHEGADHQWNGVTSFPCNAAHDEWHFDGLFGQSTEAAVKRFQRSKGLPADGVVGPATRKALGLGAGRNLRCGRGGNDVLKLQEALAARGFWGQSHHAEAAPAEPTPEPTMAPTPRPRPVATPRPAPTPRPAATPTPEPEPAWTPAPEPTPEPVSEMEDMRPTFEVRGGTWLFNNTGYFYAAGLPSNWNFAGLQPSWTGDANLWFGDFGIGGGVTAFGATLPAPSLVGGALMADGQLKWRDAANVWNLGAGYRGLMLGAGSHFGTLGLSMSQPLGVDWLLLNAGLLGGYSPNQSYLVDGNLGLGLRFRPFTLEAGVRHMTLQPVGAPTVNLNGPTASLKLEF